jgi:hypothetical protein
MFVMHTAVLRTLHILQVQIILEEEMWGVKVLYREVVSVANTIGNILKCNVQSLRWLRID